jgi:hypothetical protein
MYRAILICFAAAIAGIAAAQEAQPPTRNPPGQVAPPTPAPMKQAVSPAPTDDWVGRDVYSSDNANLGEVADLYRNPETQVAQLYVDMGGILGIGETRKLISADQIQDVQEDRIILKLTEAEADQLPASGPGTK